MRGGLLLALLALTSPALHAHQFDTDHVVIRGIGNTGTFTIQDAIGCTAAIETLSLNQLVASVQSPLGVVHAVTQTYTVIANTESGSTSILVSWTGEGNSAQFPEIECDEVSNHLIEVRVERPPRSNGGDGVAAVYPEDPVNANTGELYLHEAIDRYLGGPLPLLFRRYYGAFLQQDGELQSALGGNWSHNFDWVLKYYGNSIEVFDPEGRLLRFVDTDPGIDTGEWVLENAGSIPFQLVFDDFSSEYVLGDPRSGLLYRFQAPFFSNSNGRLRSISDTQGNTHDLDYVSGRLASVTDGLGRVLLLGYNGSGQLTSASDGTRATLFAYTDGLLTSATDARGNPTTYAYADPGTVGGLEGLLTARTRPEGNVPLTQAFDTDGRVVSQTDAGQHTRTLQYAPGVTTGTDPLEASRQMLHDAAGRLAEVIDEAGQNVSMGYDGNGRRSQLDDRLGGTTGVAYHAPSGRVARITNTDGNETAYSYTARSPLDGITFYDTTRIDHPDGSFETFGYDGDGNLTTHVDRAGQNWTYTSNGRGQALTETNPAGGVTTYIYHADGTLLSDTDPAGNTTTYSYDPLRRLVGLTRQDGSQRSFAYDANDNLVEIVNELGRTLALAYDANDNLVGITDPLLGELELGYDAMDRVVSVTDPLLGQETRSYDALGRLAERTDRAEGLTSYAYDALGRLIRVTDPGLEDWQFGHDLEGVPSSRTDPLANSEQYLSDAMGRLVQVVTPRGNNVQIGYDEVGQPQAVTNPLEETTGLSYDARGLLTGVSLQPANISASYVRDELGGITAIIDPGAQSWLASFDTSGRTTGQQDPLGNAWTIGYDTRNRIDTVNLPDGGTLTLTYDALGSMTRALYTGGDAAGADLNFTYDALNRLTSADGVTLDYDANNRIVASNGLLMTRDAEERLANLTLADGKTVTYTYDSRGRLASVADWTTLETTFEYDAAGRMTAIRRPNGIDSVYQYDADGRVTGIDEGVLATTRLTRDAKGQVVAAQRAPAAALNVTLPGDRQFTHDAASQLAGADHTARGEVTDDGVRSYTWDLASRLTGYTEQALPVAFTYDALGHRLTRTAGGTTRSYAWNYGTAIPTVNVEREDDSDLRYYVTAPDGRLLYSLGAVGDTRLDYHFDEAGNTRFLSDAAGTVAAAYAYTPYGEVLGSSGAADNPYTWQGRFGVMQEGASGLYYARARYYDSRTGRFLSRDPVGSLDPRGINPYQYAYANPLGYVDPLGLSPQPVEMGPYETAVRARIAEQRAREAERQARREEQARQRQEEKNRRGTEVREQRMRSIREAVRTKLATRTRTTTTRGGSAPDGGRDTGGGSEGGGGDPRDVATGSCPIRPVPHGRTGPRPSRPDPTTEALKAGGASVATNFAGGPIPTDVLGAQEEGTRLVIGLCDRKEREEELLGVSGRRELRQGEGYWGDIARAAGEYTIVQLFLLPFGE